MIDWEEKYKSIIKMANQMESGLIPLKNHIRGIAEYFQSKEYPRYSDVANWFWMSSSINSVEFDGIRYDSAFMMCEPAYEYEIEKQDLHSNLMNELTRFLYVYSGFESLLNSLKLTKCPSKTGKINAALYHIKTNYSINYPSIRFYTEILGLLRQLIKESSLKEYEKLFAIDECTDVNGVGLKVVYQLRNKLAHGDYYFPEPGDWAIKLPLEPEITRIATRLILISMQMIMLASNKDNFEELFLYESEVIEFDEANDEWMMNEFPFLNTFHIPTKHKNELQLELKLV